MGYPVNLFGEGGRRGVWGPKVAGFNVFKLSGDDVASQERPLCGRGRGARGCHELRVEMER